MTGVARGSAVLVLLATLVAGLVGPCLCGPRGAEARGAHDCCEPEVGLKAASAGCCAPAVRAPDAALAAAPVEGARARNPDLLAMQEAVAAARSRPRQVRSLPDPMLSFAFTNDGWSPSLGERDMTTLAVMGSQLLPWPGQRWLRGE